MKYPNDYINKIICGDHLIVIKNIPDNVIDLTVTSPPYDNLRTYYDVVLDPMCGSGTTCKMAKKNGRKYIGIDVSLKYCELSRRRVNATSEPLF